MPYREPGKLVVRSEGSRPACAYCGGDNEVQPCRACGAPACPAHRSFRSGYCDDCDERWTAIVRHERRREPLEWKQRSWSHGLALWSLLGMLAILVVSAVVPTSLALIATIGIVVGWAGFLSYPVLTGTRHLLLEAWRGSDRRLRRLRAEFEQNGGARALLGPAQGPEKS